MAFTSSLSFAREKQWYEIRDTVFGDNCVTSNIHYALALAAACEHPEALWLTSVCSGKDLTHPIQIRAVFLALCENDARGLCFTWRLGGWNGDGDLSRLRRSGELGYAFAQACLAGQTSAILEERFKFAELAAAQGERDGYYWLGWCFEGGHGCQKNLCKAKRNYLIAAELGLVDSMINLGDFLDESDPQRWRWWGMAAKEGDDRSFLCEFVEQVEAFNLGAGNAAAIFQIGLALKGHVNVEARTILGDDCLYTDDCSFDSCIGPAKQAIAFHDAQIKACRDAIHAWGLVGIRMKVMKDIRILIGRAIWDTREEARYK